MSKHKRSAISIGDGPRLRKQLPLPTLDKDLNIKLMLNDGGGMEPGTTGYRLGQCQIFLSPPCEMNMHLWHMSISHPKRYPNWDEIAGARYALIPDQVTMACILPPCDEYISIHQNCFQLWEIGRGKEFDRSSQTLAKAGFWLPGQGR